MKYIRKINESNFDPSNYYQILIDEFSDVFNITTSATKSTLIIETKICDIVDEYVKIGKNIDRAITNATNLANISKRYEELLIQIKHVEDNLKLDNLYYDINISDFKIDIFITNTKKI